MKAREAKHEKPTRRDLFAAAGRFAALGGLAAIAWLLGRRGSSRRASSCVNDGLCRSCPKLDGCILPAAQYTRRAKEADGG